MPEVDHFLAIASVPAYRRQSQAYCHLRRQKTGPLVEVNDRSTGQPRRKVGSHCSQAGTVELRD